MLSIILLLLIGSAACQAPAVERPSITAKDVCLYAKEMLQTETVHIYGELYYVKEYNVLSAHNVEDGIWKVNVRVDYEVKPIKYSNRYPSRSFYEWYEFNEETGALKEIK